ncbi:aldose 1-epimerase [Rhodovulum iodosum]|uniref:Aldose 1-epimerase n=1 Tax=Rhodovulum iodosum TaxID=68291 RepID=A0ABV3XSD9_9RHOB|nr:aldose epimerase family protein [Rhodovulum robiginosum]
MEPPRQVGTLNGAPLMRAVLDSGAMRVAILNLGCITQDWRVAQRGRDVPVVLGHADPMAYAGSSGFLGAVVGRVANRTGFGRFTLGGQEYALPVNMPPHHLHGSLGTKLWSMEADSGAGAVRLSYTSPDGEDGYPGRVAFTVTITLKAPRLTYEFEATPDRETPVNLAQHNYYNLMGGGDVYGHAVEIAAQRYTPADATLLPTGEIAPVAGTRFDFTSARRLAEADPDRQGYDLNYVLDGGQPAATVRAPNGLTLRLTTDRPGLQFYTAGGLGAVDGGHEGQTIGPFAGLCLEPQGFPDALNKPGFPPILCSPEAPYAQRLEVEVS